MDFVDPVTTKRQIHTRRPGTFYAMPSDQYEVISCPLYPEEMIVYLKPDAQPQEIHS